MIVIAVSYRLGKRSIQVLIDAKPDDKYTTVLQILDNSNKIEGYNSLRMRAAGPYTFVEVDIKLYSQLTLEEAHKISHYIESEIMAKIPRTNVHVHIEPQS